MVEESLIRLEPLINEEKLIQLATKTVVVIGLGGVGAMATEALVRSGVKRLILIDHDVIVKSNLNRQIHATKLTLGQKKVEAMFHRIENIADFCQVEQKDVFIDKSNIASLLEGPIDFVIDAIDTVTSKIAIIEYCQRNQIPYISSLGMGNRLDPSQVLVTKLKHTEYDPLAKVVRYKIRELGLSDNFNVVFSTEKPIKQMRIFADSTIRKEKMPPASSCFVPQAAGLACASFVIRKLTEENL